MFRMLFDHSPLPMWIYDPETLAFVEVNDTAVAMYGYSRDEFAKLKITDIRPPEELPRLKALLTTAREGYRHVGEWRHRLKDGRIIDVEIASHDIELSGRALVLTMVQDITERKRVADAHRRSETRLRNLFEGSIQGILIHDEKGKPLFANQAYAEIYGFATPEHLLALDSIDHLIPADEYERTIAFRQARLRGEPAPDVYEAKRFKRDGSLIWLDNRSKLIEWEGQPAVQAVVVDITERKHAEAIVRSREAALDQAHKIAKLAHYRWYGVEQRLLSHSETYLDVVGLSAESDAKMLGAAAANIHPEDRARVMEHYRSAEMNGHGVQIEFRIIRPDGKIAHIRDIAEPEPNPGGAIENWFGTIQNITDIRQAEDELRRSEERFRSLARNLPGVVYRRVMSPDGQIRDTYVSPNVKAMLGVDPDEFTSGRTNLMDFLHPADRERELQALRESAASLKSMEIEVRKIPRPGGAVRWWHIYATPTRLPGGSVQFDAIAFDETNRRAMEEQLKQSLKMEAVGQLTGGIAHDFNNLLSVVLGNADLLEERRLGDSAAQQMLQNIIHSGQQAAELTKRLLAFARKQPLEPRSVNINEFVVGLQSMLQRTLGEHIDIVLKLQPDLWKAYVDAHQIETAVLNLAINASDAMPQGGHLMIETANVTIDEEGAAKYDETRPGPYVALSVTDDGCGMPPEILARALEPFFTTKPVGKGTGLGLSMVHGFAKQSNGHMSLYSEVGHGTTVRLYFPRAAEAGKLPATGSGRDQLPSGHETILVVEDNAPLRQLAITILESLGYTVIEAATGHEALALANRGTAFDLLFSDVVLPEGMSGPVLAGEIRKQRPSLRVLYASGYTEDSIVHQGKVDEGVDLLQKPYRRKSLAQAVRAALDKPAHKN